MAGIWSLKTGPAVGVGMAVGVLHPEAARSLRLNERPDVFSRRATHYHNCR